VPLVVFEPAESGAAVEVDAPDGAPLVDLCDESDAPVPFSCRGASCGTCRVDVLEGASLLAPPRDEELDVLDIFGDDPARRRLCCQAVAMPGPGRIRVRPAGT
jgi:ferredoxin